MGLNGYFMGLLVWMPYKCPLKAKECRRKSYARRYEREEFRLAEAVRKAEWLEQPHARTLNRKSTARFREKE